MIMMVKDKRVDVTEDIIRGVQSVLALDGDLNQCVGYFSVKEWLDAFCSRMANLQDTHMFIMGQENNNIAPRNNGIKVQLCASEKGE